MAILVPALCEHAHRVNLSLPVSASQKVLSQVSAMLDRVGAIRGSDWALSVETDARAVRLFFTTACPDFAALLGTALQRLSEPFKPHMGYSGVVGARFVRFSTASIRPTESLLDDPRVQAILFGSAEDTFEFA